MPAFQQLQLHCYGCTLLTQLTSCSFIVEEIGKDQSIVESIIRTASLADVLMDTRYRDSKDVTYSTVSNQLPVLLPSFGFPLGSSVMSHQLI